jgi:hypothetical protein
MKKLFVLMLAAGFISASVSANVPFAKIPARVTDAFQGRYANATNVEWTHGLASYKATFNMGMDRFEARFDRKGRWLLSEKMLSQDRLPRAVQNSLRKTKYGRWEIKSSYEEYMPNKQPSYHIVAASGVNRKTLLFDHGGHWMNG